jgi:hypothetical protein
MYGCEMKCVRFRKEIKMSEKQITISVKDYVRLIMSSEKLNRLEIGGVDNWEWYGESLNPEGEQDLDEYEEELKKKYL